MEQIKYSWTEGTRFLANLHSACKKQVNMQTMHNECTQLLLPTQCFIYLGKKLFTLNFY